MFGDIWYGLPRKVREQQREMEEGLGAYAKKIKVNQGLDKKENGYEISVRNM